MIKYVYTVLLLLVLIGCSSNDRVVLDIESEKIYNAELTELTDDDYPDNPDISVRHDKYVETEMKKISFTQSDTGFNIVVVPASNRDDTVRMNNVQLMEFIPTIPEYSKGDEYMSLISVVNQEWNRNQVRWIGEELTRITPAIFTVNDEVITRIDLARNCLNSYLWELFFYTEIDGENKVFYHGWFDFPKELYKKLFKTRNEDDFDTYRKYMEDWKDPDNLHLELTNIRPMVYEMNAPFINKSDEMYPLKGERKKKQMAIIYPESYSKMSDFHTDSALFATFSQPGFYNRKDPRKTELGRFSQLNHVVYRKTGKDVKFDELSFQFARKNGEVTKFVFGGIKFDELPALNEEDANSGSQFSMGIGNHPFYEDCVDHEKLCSRNNPYFGVLMDVDDNWLDSHKIGIDGPLLHMDDQDPNLIHVWLLSFERHALVGHYVIDLSQVKRRSS